MIKKIKSLKNDLMAALLVLAFILTVSVPVMAEDDQTASNIKKIESARLLKEKVVSEDGNYSASSQMANGSEFSIVRLFQGLGLCIAVFLIGVHIYKKYVLKNKTFLPKSLKVVEKVALSSKSHLCVVQYNGKPLLLAVGSEKVSFYQDSEILTSLGSYADLPELQPAKELCSEKVN